MGLDIRLPIGGLFTVIGILLASYGALADRSIYQASLGINVNLRWGLVMLAFGLIMAAFGWRAGRSSAP
jgi:hypothetical protein